MKQLHKRYHKALLQEVLFPNEDVQKLWIHQYISPKDIMQYVFHHPKRRLSGKMMCKKKLTKKDSCDGCKLSLYVVPCFRDYHTLKNYWISEKVFYVCVYVILNIMLFLNIQFAITFFINFGFICYNIINFLQKNNVIEARNKTKIHMW